jgi:hypothetical protein
MVKTPALLKVCGLSQFAYHTLSQLVCFLVWETGFWCTCTICLAGVIEDGSEQKCHEEYWQLSSEFEDIGWSVKLVYTAGVRTGVHLFTICVNTGRGYARWGIRYFVMYGHRTLTAPVHHLFDNISIIFLTVISKVLFLSIAQFVRCSRRSFWLIFLF